MEFSFQNVRPSFGRQVLFLLSDSFFCAWCHFFPKQDFPQFHHISSGDLLRSHVRDGTDLGKQAKQFMDDGKLVPDKLMIDLVLDEATPHLDNGKSLLLDGFPRTVGQAQALEEEIHVDMVINLDIPTETIVERIADRCVNESLLFCCLSATIHAKVFSIYIMSFADGFMSRRVASILIRTNRPRCMAKTT